MEKENRLNCTSTISFEIFVLFSKTYLALAKYIFFKVQMEYRQLRYERYLIDMRI